MRQAIVVLFGLLLTGCVGQGFIKPGAIGYQWDGTGTISGPATMVTQRCPVGKECREVTVNDGLPGAEAYSYVWKLKIRALIGIPYGEEPITVYVIGDHAECMKQSAAHNVRPDGRVNEGSGRLSADPAERCAGPVYIR